MRQVSHLSQNPCCCPCSFCWAFQDSGQNDMNLKLNFHLCFANFPWTNYIWKVLTWQSGHYIFLRLNEEFQKQLRVPNTIMVLLMEKDPAPVDIMVNISLFTGFHTCHVVQDFFHQQYHGISQNSTRQQLVKQYKNNSSIPIYSPLGPRKKRKIIH